MNTSESALAEEAVLCRRDDAGIATLTLNRPRQYNALSEELLTDLQSALDAIKTDDSVRVVLLAANGHAFCAGHDLKQMRSRPEQAYYRELFGQCSRMMLSLVELPQPVIARVQGLATAAGCQLVATCDLAIASTDAAFAVSGVNLGLFCSTPGVALSRNLARKRAFEMLITGKFIDAQTAEAWGLINQAVPPEALDDAVQALARDIADKTPVAVRIGKEMFYRQLGRDLTDAYQYSSDVMACNMMEADTIEGIDAFLEKRTPRWHRQR